MRRCFRPALSIQAISLLSLLAFGPALATAQAPCQPEWKPTFGPAPDANGHVHCMLQFDDGNGPALYAAGEFSSMASVPANNIARFDGTTWSPLGLGTSGRVNCLCVFDDGNGPALYAGGTFLDAGGVPVNAVARWNGSAWSSLHSGVYAMHTYDIDVQTLAVYDDGSGPALFAGGGFETAGGAPAAHIAKWDGSSWSPLGSGTNGDVGTLVVHDDGSGPALYAFGGFGLAGGVPAQRVARWNGSWSALGAGLNVQALDAAVHDDGSGPALYAGAYTALVGANPADRVARWDGTAWSAVGGGLGGTGNQPVQSLASFDDGSGPALYASGRFWAVSGAPLDYLARWNGTSWSVIDDGISGTPDEGLAVFDDGHGPALYAAAVVTGAPGSRIARWNGTSWNGLWSAGLNDDVQALASFDDGSGPALYVAGAFALAGPIVASRVARWDGTSWSAVGGGFNNTSSVRALAVHDDGSGAALYAGGDFDDLYGGPSHVARLASGTWTALGSGTNGTVLALVSFDDGSGPALYAGGTFTQAGGVPANRVAQWNGASWSALGSGMGTTVTSLAVYDDGSGPALYAGGFFSLAGGVAASRVAKWDGASWSALGSGLTASVYELRTYQGELYAGGFFDHAGGILAPHVARWNGTSWSALGSGTNGTVRALEAFDDGSGLALYAAGEFSMAGGAPASRIARWDGTSWSPLGPGTSGSVSSLLAFGAGPGSALYVGGEFLNAFASGDSYLARWELPAGCGTPGTVGCEPGVGGVLGCPCANAPAGRGRGCDNSSATGGAELSASGIARLSFDSVVLTTSGERPTAISIVSQGTNPIATGVVFGQGVRCAGGLLKRLYQRNAAGGSITVPAAGEPSVSARSAALGDAIPAGAPRLYYVYYRDGVVLGGCPAGSTFNVTQQLEIAWLP